MQVLAEAGLVAVHKGYEGNRPHTSCALTHAGRQLFLDYLNVLEQVVRNASSAAEEASPVPSSTGKFKPA